MLKTYLFLIGAIFCEVAGTMLLPVSQNFTKVIPTTLLAIFYLTAFYLLTFVVNKLPIAIVYATWSGLGIFTIAILGYIFFKQTLAWQAILGLFGSGIEITAGEDSDDFAKNLVSIKGVVAFDVAVRHAQSFAAILDVTT